LALHIRLAHQGCKKQSMFRTARHTINSNLPVAWRETSQGRKGLDGVLDFNVFDVPSIPSIPPLRITVRVAQETVCREKGSSSMRPTGRASFRAVEDQNG
tara:strand:- start:658 stop:957 length:300 start_codon:yes stop_codon:yes gene_type:complete